MKCVMELPPEHGSSRPYVAAMLLNLRDEATTRMLSGPASATEPVYVSY